MEKQLINSKSLSAINGHLLRQYRYLNDIDYVTVLFSRKLMRAKADKAIDCIQFNGFYWWGTTICINTDSNKIMYVKQHEFGEKNLWYCKNKRAIEQEIIMFKELKFKPLK